MRPAGDSVFVAVIGDLVGSSQLPNRAAVQRSLHAAIGSANEALADVIVAPADITAGDDSKVLLEDSPAAAERFVQILRTALFPHAMRFGVGRGGISTLLSDSVGHLDGSCFHAARHAVKVARENNALLQVDWLGAEGPMDEFLPNAVFRHTSRLRGEWTEVQARYAHAVETGLNQLQVASRFQVAPSTVSESLKSARVREILELEHYAWNDLQTRGGAPK